MRYVREKIYNKRYYPNYDPKIKKYSIRGTLFIDKPNCFCQSIYVKKILKTRKEQKRKKNIQGGSLYEPRI